MYRFSLSFLCLVSVFYVPQIWAQTTDVQVELNSNNPTYTNTGTITTQNGYGVWLNGIGGFSGTLVNTGDIKVTGIGYGVYETPYSTKSVSLKLDNAGIIQRIQLEQTDGSSIINATNGDIQGEASFGVNSIVANYGGKFSNFELDDSSREKGNLLSFGYNSYFGNGVQPVYSDAEDSDGKDKPVLIDVTFYNSSTVTTDKVQFAEKGTFYNGTTLNNKLLVFGDNGILRNIENAYNETNAGGTISDAATITTEKLVVGKNSSIINEMGGILTANSLITDSGTTIENGADYLLKPINDETKKYSGVIPHISKMNVEKAQLGNSNTLLLNNKSEYTGTSLTMGTSGKIENAGSVLTLTTDDKQGVLQMGDGGTLNINGSKWNEVVKTEKEESQNTQKTATILSHLKTTAADETNTGTTGGKTKKTVILPEQLLNATVTVDTLKMGNGSSLNVGITGASIQDDNKNQIFTTATLNTEKSILGDNTTVVLGDDATYVATWTANNSISLGNNSSVSNTRTGTINADTVIYKTNGKLLNSGSLNATKLTMGNNAQIDNTGKITAKTTVGSDSIVNILGGSGEYDLKKSWKEGGAFSNGIIKSTDAKNVKIVSQTGFDSEADANVYGYLTGGVNVDNILIQTGELRVSGDIRGNIDMATDTRLRLVNTDMAIHDPISKLNDATNTTLIVDLTDDSFYKTLNTINVDHLVLEGGGIEIAKPVQAEEITLGSNTTVKLKGNYFTGDMVELDGDAANTTLDIDAGEKAVINSTGEIKVDRVIVENGTFEVNHSVEAVYKTDTSIMPSGNEQGLEIGTNATVNINADDVKVNRIVRHQEAEAKGEHVQNTTVNLNNGYLGVERNVDVDNLNVNKGLFEFKNTDTDNVVNVGNRVVVNHGAQIAGAGMMNLRAGSMDINEGGRLSVSTELVENKPIATMELIQSETVQTDADEVSDKGNATLNLKTGSILDLRADNNTSDKIVVSGTANLSDGARVIVRNIQANQEYDLITATQLNGNIDKLSSSFLWEGTEFKNNNNTLSLKISGIQTLNEGIASTKHSKNIDSIAKALTHINDSAASNTIDPFLDNVFYAKTADIAISGMNEYSPEGYLNLQQGVLRMNRTFRQSALSELDAMRTYKDVENMYNQQPMVTYNPNYYGRPGYEAYYANWNSNRTNRRRTRTDKGGLWAKPFMVSVTQDDKDNMSGYELSGYGVTAGIDRRFGAMSIGAMGMYASGTMEQNNKVTDTDMTTMGVGIYGNYRPRKTRQFIDFYALWTQTSNKATHKINSLVESAKADFDITAYSIGADMGYDMPINRHIIITPKVGIDYTKISTDDITEVGTGHGRVNVTVDDFTSIQTPVEVRAAFNYGSGLNRFKPEVHARWTHEFGDTATSGKGLFVNYNQPFGVEGLNADKDTFTLGGSLLWLYNVSEVELKYDYDFSSSSSGHTVNASYKYMF